jgi:HEPN pEK499 p136
METELPTLDGRNTVWGIRDRTLKNLEFLYAARVMGADVHIVTALLTSLLGLIVFPCQQIQESKDTKDKFKTFKLEELEKNGWPKWNISPSSRPTEDLHELISHLRNAVSHRRVIFSSDAKDLKKVKVRFSDRKNRDGPDDWDATINAAELHVFVTLFARMLKQWQVDYS